MDNKLKVKKRTTIFTICFLVIFLIVGDKVYAQEWVRSNNVVTKIGDAPEDQRPQGGGGKGEKAPVVEPSRLRESILSEFGIQMDGFNQSQLQWAWDKFWDIKHTNFIQLVHGKAARVRVQAVAPSLSEQHNCELVDVGGYSSAALFKVVLLHELGHIIYWCNDDRVNLKIEHGVVVKAEGGVTGYGGPSGSSCTGTLAITENYPEMLTYYLNPGVPAQTAACAPRQGEIPYSGGKFPMHYQLAKKILGEY